MSLTQVQLSLLIIITVISLTSSQPTVDVTQPDNNVCRSGQTDQVLSVLNQLVTAVSQTSSRSDQAIGQLMTIASQLHESSTNGSR